ncbi:glycosyltransferase [Algoriphagus hitonicola]|uniref:Glycosyltransferase involved in cell wall bisynthesis n=1 Tax=Algoriphagus hitonicola TaxID=435880 RepID=A0A1I2TNV1_9BACT|nr:glycosyltransferase [Algoriphagus hitonicola]SFG64011.1 Glycosyltransferase involved in cell wall bisynthesis [Algoriphagus hitonicola]
MNILIIPSWYPTEKKPFAGFYFLEQAKFLNGKVGINISILFGDKKSSPLLKWLLTLAQSVFFRNIHLIKSGLFQSPEKFEFTIPANRRIPDFIQLWLERKLYKKAFASYSKRYTIPDLVHAQSGMDAAIYAKDIANLTGLPFVILEHQVFVFHYYSRKRAGLILEAFAAARKTAAVSYDERRQVLMNKPNCNPEVIWNFVDETKYHIQLDKRSKVFTIVTILNSLPIKGFDTFLEAMFELSKETQDFRFIMIGKGADERSNDPTSNAFVIKSKELCIYDFGTFFPIVERDQISDVLNTAHVFVSPTIQEPHGIAAREAMMCGLPVVSTANGGVEDGITPETGLIVPVKSPNALVEAILKIHKNIHLYNPQTIRELTIQQCGRKAFLDRMIKFYNV